MSQLGPLPALPVLTEENLWPEFATAIVELGPRWRAPSGRTYLLEPEAHTLTVSLLAAPGDTSLSPPATAVDDDLFELACQLQDAVGGDWSGTALRKAAAIFGWPDRQ